MLRIRFGFADVLKLNNLDYKSMLYFTPPQIELFKLVDYRIRGIRLICAIRVKITNAHESAATKSINSAEKFGLYRMSKTYALVCGQHRFSVRR